MFSFRDAFGTKIMRPLPSHAFEGSLGRLAAALMNVLEAAQQEQAN